LVKCNCKLTQNMAGNQFQVLRRKSANQEKLWKILLMLN